MKPPLLLAAVSLLAATTVAATSVSAGPVPGRAFGAGDGARAAGGDGPMGAGYHEEIDFPSLDGTMLHADILLPAPPDEAPPGGWPVVFSIGPYFGEGQGPLDTDPLASGPVERFADFIEGVGLFERGYAWAQVDSRGYGSSGGCNDLGGIGEQMDVFAAAEYLGEAPWSSGRVGMWGKSYDGWTQVMGLAMNPPHLEAVVIQAPLIEGYRFVWQNGIHFNLGWYASPGLYTVYDYHPPSVADGSPTEQVDPLVGTATEPTCQVENVAMHAAVNDHDAPFWQERDLIPRARDSEVPVLWSHGFNDVNTKPHNVLDVYGELPGYHRGWFGHWAHDRGNEAGKVGRDGFLDEAIDFLDVHLKGERAELEVTRQQLSRAQTQNGDWYVADQWPPSHTRPFALDLLPGTYVDQAGASDGDPADGTWTFTPPAPYDVHLAGEPRVTVEVEVPVANANLFAKVYDVSPDGSAAMISHGAQLLRQSGTFTFDSFPSDWVLAAGHRIGVLLTSSDGLWTPYNTNQTVEVTRGTVELPFLTRPVRYDLFDQPASSTSRRASIETSLFENRTQSVFAWPPEVE